MNLRAKHAMFDNQACPFGIDGGRIVESRRDALRRLTELDERIRDTVCSWTAKWNKKYVPLMEMESPDNRRGLMTPTGRDVVGRKPFPPEPPAEGRTWRAPRDRSQAAAGPSSPPLPQS